MPAPIAPAVLNDAVEHYLTGESVEGAASAVGISEGPLTRELHRRGVMRPRGGRKPFLTIPAIPGEYEAGASVLELAHRYGVSRTVVDRHLRDAGITKRTPSEQNVIAALRQTPAQRKARAVAAHAARRGHTPRASTMAKAAATREAKGQPQSPGERRMLRWLEERGETVRIQAAVERYNVDFAIAGLAVELLGGEWHARKRTHATRTKTLLDAGWHVLFIWDTPTYPIEEATADYAVAFAKFSRLDPTAIRQYRVIRGDGQEIAGGSLENYNFALIPAARGSVKIRADFFPILEGPDSRISRNTPIM